MWKILLLWTGKDFKYCWQGLEDNSCGTLKSPFFLGNPHMKIDETVIQGFWVTYDRPTYEHDNVNINSFDDIYKMQDWGRSGRTAVHFGSAGLPEGRSWEAPGERKLSVAMEYWRR